MSGSISGAYDQQRSRSKQVSYGPLGSESGGIRGQGQNILANLLFGREQGRMEGTGFGEGGTLGALFARSRQEPAYEAPDLMGAVQGGVNTAFDEAVRQGVGRYSADYARRGMTRPENIAAMVGSAVQNVAPQFASLYGQTAVQDAQGRAQAPLIREELTRQRFADLLAAMGINIQALGGQSEGGTYSKGFGMSHSSSGGIGGGGGGGMMGMG